STRPPGRILPCWVRLEKPGELLSSARLPSLHIGGAFFSPRAPAGRFCCRRDLDSIVAALLLPPTPGPLGASALRQSSCPFCCASSCTGLAGLKISVFCPKSALNAAWADFVSVDSSNFVLRICCEMDFKLVFLLAARTASRTRAPALRGLCPNH